MCIPRFFMILFYILFTYFYCHNFLRAVKLLYFWHIFLGTNICSCILYLFCLLSDIQHLSHIKMHNHLNCLYFDYVIIYISFFCTQFVRRCRKKAAAAQRIFPGVRTIPNFHSFVLLYFVFCTYLVTFEIYEQSTYDFALCAFH